jgi:hypothetical protein
LSAAQQETLGLWPEPLPPLPRSLEGYERDDEVWLFEGERRTAARVIAVLRSCHTLTLRTADHRIVSVNPSMNAAVICKRSATA